jgi:hypothetical protein
LAGRDCQDGRWRKRPMTISIRFLHPFSSLRSNIRLVTNFDDPRFTIFLPVVCLTSCRQYTIFSLFLEKDNIRSTTGPRCWLAVAIVGMCYMRAGRLGESCVRYNASHFPLKDLSSLREP